MIKDFIQNETVTAVVALRKKNVKEFEGKTFLSMEFGDNTGRIAAVWWEPEGFAVDDLKEGDIVKVKGTVAQYRGKPQLKVAKMRLAVDTEYDLADMLPHSQYPISELKSKILSLSERIENSHIKKLAFSFWDDEEFMAQYLHASAGKLWHHSFIGGLAEHSTNVTEICLALARRYEFLDKDLLIFGGLFHDMGKIYQYNITSYIDYSDEGRLVGHINSADSKIVQQAKQIENFPEMLLLKLRHLILSHHGQIEFASPVTPQIPEAFVLYYSDEIDSKMGAIDRIREKTGGSGWSEYVNLLGRHLYFGDEE
ncbi:MAG: HD domain-containing protein [Candidatus Zixiibacteriota bacterium]